MVRCAPVFTVFRCGGAGGRCGGCANWGRGMVAVRGSETGPEGAGQEFGAKRMRTIVILRDRAVLVSVRMVSAGASGGRAGSVSGTEHRAGADRMDRRMRIGWLADDTGRKYGRMGRRVLPDGSTGRWRWTGAVGGYRTAGAVGRYLARCTDRRRMPGAGACIGRRNEKASPAKGGFRVGGGGGRSAGGYFTRRLVAVSGKMTHGRNCFASSKSISA